ncbi:MAG: Uma2 family endonuclease [Akkermansiaceae bacterium]
MSSTLKINSLITPEEYLEGEIVSEVRHEYIDGVVYAMSGGTLNHNTISLNIASSLNQALSGSPCRPFINDVKVQVKTLSNESYYYPDVVVSCDKAGDHPLYLEKPTTIFEVLSDSTERIDRNEKFLAYTSIPSLQEYILVAQDRKEVIIVRRENNWEPEFLTGDDFETALSCTDSTLTSSTIYNNVDLL